MNETTKTYNESKPYLWDSKLEIALAQFCERLEELRGINRFKSSKYILETFVRKKENSQVSATPGMRKYWNLK